MTVKMLTFTRERIKIFIWGRRKNSCILKIPKKGEQTMLIYSNETANTFMYIMEKIIDIRRKI